MIGVDFDNTIVRYDDVFGRVALDLGLVPPQAATSKTAVRDHLRSIGQEDRWTELQGIIYGPRMMDAGLFPGVAEFFRACRAAGMPVAIVSHRTRFPYLGERHDLHAAARDFLARHGFHDEAGIGLPAERVFFEETKEAKLARIAELGCTHFIDDLPELLAHPLFPARVRKILFDPPGQHPAVPGIDPASSWEQLAGLLLDTLQSPLPLGEAGRRPGEGACEEAHIPGTLTPARSQRERERRQAPSPQPSPGGRGDEGIAARAERVLDQGGVPRPRRLEPIAGGGNNRVYRVESTGDPVVLKVYFRHAADLRDRLKAEFGFSSFAWDLGVRALPRPLASDPEAGMAVYEFIAGTKLAAGEVTSGHVAEAAAFFRDIDRHRLRAAGLPAASEGCFSIAEHLACIESRVGRLLSLDRGAPLGHHAHELVTSRIVPAWQAIRDAACVAAADATVTLPPAERCVSPSDFGFHNAVVATADGRLRFLDFEYAGHDDPAKLVCDFFCQPAVPVPREHLPSFLLAAFPDPIRRDAVARRAALLLPAYEIKWCCILLNEFLPAGDRRRAFASGADSMEDRRAGQLDKVEAALNRLLDPSRPAGATPRNPPP